MGGETDMVGEKVQKKVLAPLLLPKTELIEADEKRLQESKA